MRVLQGSTIDNNLTIACKENQFTILEIQKEGKKLDKQPINFYLAKNSQR